MKLHNKDSLSRILFLSLLIGFFCAVIFLRLHCLDADFDDTLTWSQAPYNDEGMYAGNAIKKYLTGRWLCDSFNMILLYPVMPVVYYAIFKLFGMSLVTVRMPAAILSLLAIAAVSFLIHKEYRQKGRGALFLFVFLAGTNYYFFSYSRVAFLWVPMISVGLLSLFFLYRALTYDVFLKKAWVNYFLAGELLALSFLIIPFGAYFLTLPLAVLFLRINGDRHFKAHLAGIGFALASALATIALVYAALRFFVTDYSRLIHKGFILNKLYFDIPEIMRRYREFFYGSPYRENTMLFAAAFLHGGVLLARRIFQKKEMPLSLLIMVALLLASYLFTGYFSYKPPRYLLVTIMPVLFCAATLPLTLKDIAAELTPQKHKRLLQVIVISVTAALLVFANTWNLARLSHYVGNYQFSIRDNARAIRRLIYAEQGAVRCATAVLYGQDAPQYSLTNQLNFEYTMGPQDVAVDYPLYAGAKIHPAWFPVYFVRRLYRPINDPHIKVLGRFNVMHNKGMVRTRDRVIFQLYFCRFFEYDGLWRSKNNTVGARTQKDLEVLQQYMRKKDIAAIVGMAREGRAFPVWAGEVFSVETYNSLGTAKVCLRNSAATAWTYLKDVEQVSERLRQ